MQRYIKACIRFAKNKHPDPDYYHQIAALALSSGTIESKGFNCPKSNPKAKRIVDKYNIKTQYEHQTHEYTSFKLHAEQSAIKSASSDIDTIIVCRMTPGGVLACAKPCKICQAYMFEEGVSKVIYSDDDEFIEKHVNSFPILN